MGTLVASEATGFADGNAGHVYTYPAGAPDPGEVDVLSVNSNTTVSTPSGYTLRLNATNNQGSYVFTRKAVGGEATTTTITTNGNENAELHWERWSDVGDYEAGNFVRADNSNDTQLPAASTGTLPSAGGTLLVFGHLHNHDGALATSPVWDNLNGFIEVAAGTQGSAGASNSVAQFSGYKDNVGTASEDTNRVTWTNNVRNRYNVWVYLSAGAASTNADAEAATFTLSAQAASADVRPGAQVAAFSLSGLDASVSRSESATPATATFTVTAQGATTTITTTAQAATFTLAAQDANAEVGSTTNADAETAAFTIQGNDASIAILSQIGTATFSLTGQDAAATIANGVSAQAAEFTIAGQAANASLSTAAQTATFSLAALNATIQGAAQVYSVTATLPADGPVTATLPSN